MKRAFRTERANDPMPWIHGRVPDGFWSCTVNRRRYMDWLAKTCGFTKLEDWHLVTKHHFHDNRGGGLLANYYRDSPVRAVRDYRPEHAWKVWLFKCVPQGFWHDPQNRRDYMDWLGDELGYVTTSDWYAIVKEEFYRHAGGGLLSNHYGDSPFAALRDYRPSYPWKAWLFTSTPQGFWRDPEHRRQYMCWLGTQLEVRTPEDWYVLRRKHFLRHSGAGLLASRYDDSPLKALREYLPDFDWDAARFPRTEHTSRRALTTCR